MDLDIDSKEVNDMGLPSPVTTSTGRSSETIPIDPRWPNGMTTLRKARECWDKISRSCDKITPYCKSAAKAAKNAYHRFIGKDMDLEVFVRRLAETGENSSPKGYPNLAVFLDSDENFMMYRRFGYLQSRVLLEKQNSLRVLEQKLDEMDQLSKPSWLQSHNIPKKSAESRRNLFQDIEKKINEYAKLMKSAHRFMSLNRPTNSEYRSLRNYFDLKAPLIEEEASWIYHKEDLVTLRPGRDHAWLDAGIENFLKRTHCGLVEWLFCDTYTRKKSSGAEVYYSRSRIENLVAGIITLMILTLLIIPIWILYHLAADISIGGAYTTCIGIMLVFTLAFSAILSLFTRARRHEILAAAAAYCAVLVVFLGNTPSQS